MRTIKKVIVHCSDSDFGNMEIIRQWHLENGWSDIGYHYVILNGVPEKDKSYHIERDGEIQVGRDVTRSGAHCKGHNHSSVGICLIGRNHFSAVQLFKSLPMLLILLMNTFSLGLNDIYGHYQFDQSKTCPNLPIEDIKSMVSNINRMSSK